MIGLKKNGHRYALKAFKLARKSNTIKYITNKFQ